MLQTVIYSFILFFQKTLSFLFGPLMRQKLPWISSKMVSAFAKYYKIDVSEAEQELSEYESVVDFFTRKLKTTARPVDFSALFVHPADSQIKAHGLIKNNQAFQIKGQNYSLSELLGDSKKAFAFEGGFFADYYLSPRDYHRVHSPVEGQMLSLNYISGLLWPVNHWGRRHISSLFCKNERIVFELQTPYGLVSVIMVGALCVGQMSISVFSSEEEKRMKSFQAQLLFNINSIYKRVLPSPVAVKKGDELGVFHMGSTVVVLLPSDWPKLHDFLEWSQKPFKVKCGESSV